MIIEAQNSSSCHSSILIQNYNRIKITLEHQKNQKFLIKSGACSLQEKEKCQKLSRRQSCCHLFEFCPHRYLVNELEKWKSLMLNYIVFGLREFFFSCGFPEEIQTLMSSPAFLETDYLIMIFVIQSPREERGGSRSMSLFLRSCPRIGAFLEAI